MSLVLHFSAGLGTQTLPELDLCPALGPEHYTTALLPSLTAPNWTRWIDPGCDCRPGMVNGHFWFAHAVSADRTVL